MSSQPDARHLAPQHVAESGPSRLSRLLFPGAVLVGVAVLLFRNIGRQSIWGDEGFSVSTSRGSLRDVLRLSVDKEMTGAPYALLLNVWMKLGTSEAILRSLSAVMILASIAMTGWIGYRFGGVDRAVLAMAFMGLHGLVLEYGQTIRFYSLVLFVATLSMLAFVEDVRLPRVLSYVVWLATCVVLPLCHLLAAPIICAQIVSLFVVPWPHQRRIRRLVGLMVAGSVSLVVAALVRGRDEGQELVFFGTAAIKEVALSLTGSGGPIGLVAVGACIGASMWALAPHVLRVRHVEGGDHVELGDHIEGQNLDSHESGDYETLSSRFAAGLPIAWLFTPIALLLVVSVVQPAFLGRYLLVVTPAIALLIAGATDELFSHSGWRRIAGVILAGSTLASLAFGAYQWLTGTRGDNWREVSCLVLRNGRPTDAMLFANDSVRLFHEYERTQPRPSCQPSPLATGGPVGEPQPAFPSGPWGTFGTGDHRYVPFGLPDVQQALSRHDRIWLVTERGIELSTLLGTDPQTIGRVVLDERIERTGRVVLIDRYAPDSGPLDSVPAGTVPAGTVPPETVPPETVPPETVPPETVPPETVPPETVPSDPIVQAPPSDDSVADDSVADDSVADDPIVVSSQ
jgi:4-amino-4-deoxy-L-arabinose transferase-like glycosyltransferase